MEPNLQRLRFALARHLGQTLTPEVAAEISVIAVANPMPIPNTSGQGGISSSQAQHLFDFMNERVDGKYDPSTTRILSRLDPDGTIRGVVGFTGMTKYSLEMVVASDGSSRWINRAFLREAFSYPFIQLGLLRVTGRVRETDFAALGLNMHLGFVVEGRMADAFGPGETCVVLGMQKAHCRWIKGASHD